MHESEIIMNPSDVMVENKPEVEMLYPEQFTEGFGFGEGTISFKTRRDIIGAEIVDSVEAAVASTEILIPVSKDKDGNRTTPVQESVVEYLQRRADSFYTAVQEEVDNAITKVQQECDGLLAREEEILRESDAIIQRLEPQVT